MKVLIIFGTTEGQTRKIAERMETQVRERGHEVELLDASKNSSSIKFEEFGAFIVAASVHQKHHQTSITDFAFAHHELLNGKPSALVSVSLSAALEGHGPDAQSYVDSFVLATKWQPAATLLIGGAVRYTEYDFFQEQFVKFVVMKGGGADTEGDHEFTDWEALAEFVDGFLESAS